MFLNYPNNPTGGGRHAPRSCSELVDFARSYDIAICYDNPYIEIVFDGEKPLSFLSVPGRQGRRRRAQLALQAVQHDRLAHRHGARQPGPDRGDLEGEGEHRLRRVQRHPVRRHRRLHALRGARSPHMLQIYARRRDLVVATLRQVGIEYTPPQRHVLSLGADAERHVEPRRSPTCCSRRPASSSPPAAATASSARASSASRSPCPTRGSRKRWSGCAGAGTSDGRCAVRSPLSPQRPAHRPPARPHSPSTSRIEYRPTGCAGEPDAGAHGAARQAVAALGAVGELEALAQAGEDDGVVADDVAAAQRDDADLARRCACRRCPRAPAAWLRSKSRPQAGGDGAAERQRGAARRVDLHAVVDLDDLGVEARRRAPRPPASTSLSSTLTPTLMLAATTRARARRQRGRARAARRRESRSCR